MAAYRTSDAAAPAHSAAAVTPNDSTDIKPTRALYVGVTGNIKVDMADTGSAITFTAVPVGIIPIQVTRVYATGTTATDIVALY